MNKLPAVLGSLILCACAAAPPPPQSAQLFNDHLFAAPSVRVSADSVFAVSDAMKHYLNVEIADQLSANGRQRGLFEALYRQDQLRLEYDSAMTRNATETFAARSGNCLSLVIMTAAMARQLGLPVRYQRVFTDETWTRSGDIYFSSGHINLTLGKRHPDPRFRYDEHHLLTIDFIPLTGLEVQHTWEIGESTIIAMYMNNRAAESLAQGKTDDAYWWAREGIIQDPKFLDSYNILGVIYRRHGNPLLAEQVLNEFLVREPGNIQAMSNLALVLNDQGRLAESRALARKVEEKQPYPPFHFFNLGQAAMRAGDFAAARDQFAREIAREPNNPEFHFWIAGAYNRLGDVERARKHLAIAVENSATRGDRDIYAAKLDRIKSLAH